MTILDKVARIVNSAKEHEAERPYTFERAEFARLGEAKTWLRTWQAENGNLPWLSSQFGDKERERLALHWLWLRFCFRDVIREREALGHEQVIWERGHD